MMLKEQIKNCNESVENPSINDSINDDGLARVLGPESRGCVRGLGFGAIPSRVAATVQCNAVIKGLESRMAMFEAQMASLLKEKQENQSKNLEDIMSSHVATPQSEQGSHPLPNQTTMNQKCQLLHWYIEGEEVVAEGRIALVVVAEGRIASVDTSAKVHHAPLGRDFWKVWVDRVYNDDLQLVRSNDEFSKLGEALGSTIAWPKSSIKIADEDS